jgi:hypothetical protein
MGTAEEKLSALFPGQIARLTIPWEQCQWSATYKAELVDGRLFYLKGTPRSRPEAQVTSILHRYRPDCIPEVLVEDLIPEDPWRWFLLEDAGTCSYDRITPASAVMAAFQLGRLQKTVCRDGYLASSLPRCRAEGLQVAVSEVCSWALRIVPVDTRESLLSLRDKLLQSERFFHTLQKQLAHLPPTCVHGDLWSGNIACKGGTVSLIDWGDALWGVGSISIVNLLDTANGALTGHADDIWDAYGRGWEKDIPDDFIEASRCAALVGSLLIDIEIAKCCGGTVEMPPGLLPDLERLVSSLPDG